ncbi:MAG TPA: DUF4097 family beta strand repeat-containing protein [Candidatus Angelobacter sp.]|nr:DUF4097 family beta strand repeat-containing protein [Candidatus Angelobacter sp.]
MSAIAAEGQAPVFQRTLELDIKSPLILTVELSRGDITIAYRNEGQFSISGFGKEITGKSLPEEFFKTALLIDQEGNRITIRESPEAAFGNPLNSTAYRLDVPFRTQVSSSISGTGNQKLIGISGPAKITSGAGDIEAQLVSLGSVDAHTGKGNISCSRVSKVTAETGDGNITLLETGPSKAVVSSGRGRIEVAGARGSVDGSVSAGSLHINAVPHGAWKFNSVSGSIRIELPPKAAFNLDAATISGEIDVEHKAMQQSDHEVRHLQQQVNGGGKQIEVRSISGLVVIE